MILTSEIELLAGSRIIDETPLRCLADLALDFVADFAERISRDNGARAFPDILALGFWCRGQRLKKIAAEYPDARFRVGRGLSLHITPGNIPTNWVYSLLFGILAGNPNIARLSTREFGQTPILLALLGATFEAFPELKKRNAIIRYPASDTVTAALCQRAWARVLWGSEASTSHIRAMPTLPRCQDLVFSDRHSLALMDGRAVLALTEAEMDRLAERFYNDTFLMDQNACSSPHLLLWRNDSPKARERFWNALEKIAARRYELSAITAVDKLVMACREYGENALSEPIRRHGNFIYRLPLNGDAADYRCPGGYFHEGAIANAKDLDTFINGKTQTLVYFGVDAVSLREEIMAQSAQGVDRIVPCGAALEISHLWDGHDLLRELTRIVTLA